MKINFFSPKVVIICKISVCHMFTKDYTPNFYSLKGVRWVMMFLPVSVYVFLLVSEQIYYKPQQKQLKPCESDIY